MEKWLLVSVSPTFFTSVLCLFCNGKRDCSYIQKLLVSKVEVCLLAGLLPLQMAYCVYLFMLLVRGLWEKRLSMVRIDERKIRVLSGLGRACMDTILLCENFLFSYFPHNSCAQDTPRTIPSTGEHWKRFKGYILNNANKNSSNISLWGICHKSI